MHVYRVGLTRFAKDVTGEGARLFGGRWNHKLTPCIYTSENRALAILEYSVNVSIENIPRDLSITTFEIPDKSIYNISIADLPGNWKDSPIPNSTKDFGTLLLQQGKFHVLKFPSAILPAEFNYVINPLHANANLLKIISVDDLVYDARIKKK